MAVIQNPCENRQAAGKSLPSSSSPQPLHQSQGAQQQHNSPTTNNSPYGTVVVYRMNPGAIEDDESFLAEEFSYPIVTDESISARALREELRNQLWLRSYASTADKAWNLTSQASIGARDKMENAVSLVDPNLLDLLDVPLEVAVKDIWKPYEIGVFMNLDSGQDQGLVNGCADEEGMPSLESDSSSSDPPKLVENTFPAYGPHLPGGDKGASGDADEQKPSTSGTSSGGSWDRRARDDNDRPYVGLVNQAMTCYLNSLIQTLYMTPEFRNTLYKSTMEQVRGFDRQFSGWLADRVSGPRRSEVGGRAIARPETSSPPAKLAIKASHLRKRKPRNDLKWEYDGSQEQGKKSIPFQLQKLFLQLQTSEKESLETKDLTKSFGWDSSDAFDQHDVQELCRVMFDALELIWRKKSASHASLVQDMYQGQMKDYVKCLQCGTESSREVIFLDLQLAVKPFGVSNAYKSVEEALEAFVQPETLEGSNQYECEKCKKKCDAHKGLKVTKFPYLLTLQLKRFDFDYTTLHRIKLNDRMTFSDVLNLNKFVSKDAAESATPSQGRSAPLMSVPEENEDVASRPETPAEPPPVVPPPQQRQPIGDSDDDEGISLNDSACSPSTPSPVDSGGDGEADSVFEGNFQGRLDRKVVEKALKEGPYVYELFSVMVHSGSASGGHYYAYIKNLDQGTWFCFNDQRVTSASLEDIEKTFGASAGGSWSWSSNTNAYMLMYRQIDRNRNDRFLKTESLPAYLIDLKETLKEEEEKNRLEKEYQDSLLEITVHFLPPGAEAMQQEAFPIPHSMSTKELLTKAHDRSKLAYYKPPIPLERCRLVRMETYNQTLGDSIEESETETINKCLTGWGTKRNVFLEWRNEQEVFLPYKQIAGVTVHLNPIVLPSKTVGTTQLFWAKLEATVKDVQDIVAARFQTKAENVRLAFFQSHDKVVRYLDAPSRRLKEDTCSYVKLIKLFADVGFEEDAYVQDRQLGFDQSEFWAAIDVHLHVRQYSIALPLASEFEKMKQPMPEALMMLDELKSSEETNSKIVFVPSPVIIGTLERDRRNSEKGEEAECGGSSRLFGPAEEQSVRFMTAKSLLENEREQTQFRNAKLAFGTEIGRGDGDSGRASPSPPNPSPQVSPIANVSSSFANTGIADETGLAFQEEDKSPALISETPDPCFQDALSRAEEKLSEQTANVTKAYSELNNLFGTTPESKGTPEKKTDIPPPPPPPPLPTPSAPLFPDKRRKVMTEAEVKEETEENMEKYCFFGIVDFKEQYGRKVLTVQADERMRIVELKQKIGEVMRMDANQFTVWKLTGTAPACYEFEIRDEDQLLERCNTVEGLLVKLGRPLKEGEFLVKVMRFDMQEKEEHWQHLFDLTASNAMAMSEIYEQTEQKLADVCAEKVPVDRLRLRTSEIGCLDVVERSGIFRDSSATSKGVVLQVLEKRDPLLDRPLDYQSVFVRRWFPSELRSGPIQELLVRCRIGFRKTKEEVSRVSGISANRLELSDARSTGKYPFEEERLSLLERERFYREGTMDDEHPLTRDGQLIYYRDSTEVPKKLTAEERKEIQIKDSACQRKGNGSYLQRKERALKIYTELSTSIADEDLD